MTTLPDKLSDLIVAVVGDAIACEKDPAYRLNMGEWLKYDDLEPETCQVCLAGAYIAKTIESIPDGSSPGYDISPVEYGQNVLRKLTAIDCVRDGSISVALEEMGVSGVPEDLVIECENAIGMAYNIYMQRAPWDTYLEIARRLAEAGY